MMITKQFYENSILLYTKRLISFKKKNRNVRFISVYIINYYYYFTLLYFIYKIIYNDLKKKQKR